MAAYNICLQVSFILVQILFGIFGIIMIAVGAWLEVQERTITAAIESEEFLAGPYLIIGAGCAIVLVAIIGIVGAMCDKKINRFLLYFYIVLVLIIFAAQLAGGILAFVYRDLLTTTVEEGLTVTLERYGVNTSTNTVNQAVTESWDFVQENLECCGLMSVLDWTNQSMVYDNGAFPISCCVDPTADMCNVNTTNTDTIHNSGCIQALTDFAREQLLIVAAVGIAFVVGEIVVVLMAFCLVCCTDFED